MAPEDNPADDCEITKDDWEEYEKRQAEFARMFPNQQIRIDAEDEDDE